VEFIFCKAKINSRLISIY